MIYYNGPISLKKLPPYVFLFLIILHIYNNIPAKKNNFFIIICYSQQKYQEASLPILNDITQCYVVFHLLYIPNLNAVKGTYCSE